MTSLRVLKRVRLPPPGLLVFSPVRSAAMSSAVGPGPTPSTGAGSPIGLLLALTKVT